MAKHKRKKASIFDGITLEGGLISSAMLGQIAERKAGQQAEADYGVPKGLALRDEIARYYRIGEALFKDLNASAKPSAAATLTFTEELLRSVLGFAEIKRHEGDGIAFEASDGRVPVVVVAPSDDLDRASSQLTGEGRRRSAASALQDWLNQQENCLWGLCGNGDRLRLLRDNASLTRPAYVEVNFRQIFEGENFADFAAAWLLLHASRFGAAGTTVTDCHLERWREAGAKEGLVARERLRDGVEAALLALGNGFLAHADNGNLRARLANGELALAAFFGQLLRLVYRMIFLLVAEDRGLLHAPEADASARKLYADGYGLAALRERAVRRTAWDRHYDRWEGLLITFRGLADGQAKLGLPALGGLFENIMADLEGARLSNKALMEAVFRLAWLKDEASLLPVNWRDMETEELGSVYESLLELTPLLVDDGRGFAFAQGDETKGNQRKKSGSYYTPDSLVQTLLDSALDPVLDRVESEAKDRAQSLLSVTVIDPACGSGHFLLAAARRIATRVARARTGGVAAAADYRHALRDVVRACVHGVDRNPMAVELAKVALWIETVEPGKPLGFLDASILCGDSLLGVFDLEVLRKGIPDAAYKPLMGDDKAACKYFNVRNKEERDGFGTLDFGGGPGTVPTAPPLAAPMSAVKSLPEDSTEEIAEKKRRLAAAKRDRQLWNWKEGADLYMAAFLLPKKEMPQEPGAALTPSSNHVWRKLAGHQVYGPLAGVVEEVAQEARLFHWPIEFPDVMARGGFDVVIGNPPWERIKIQEEEFFAARQPSISAAPTADARRVMIAALSEAGEGTAERRLFKEFELAKRAAAGAAIFAREGGRFPLTGRGDVNTYALFAELFARLVSPAGSAGVIVPTGIAFDDTTRLFFQFLVAERRLVRLLSFYEVRRWFRATDDRKPFCLLITGATNNPAEFSFDIRDLGDLAISERRFSLTGSQIAHLNPNTMTAPLSRTRADVALLSKICSRVPILILERAGHVENPWAITFMRMFDMATDSGLFHATPAAGLVPLLEAKMVHQFDSRWCTYDGGEPRSLTAEEKADPSFAPLPRYWVDEQHARERLAERNWERQWLIGWRQNARSDDDRTLIVSSFPPIAVGHSLSVLFCTLDAPLQAVLIGCLNSLVLDFVVRQKVGGSNLSYHFVKQFPVPPPSVFQQADLDFVVPRVLELSFTSLSLRGFAADLGYVGPPFVVDDARRAVVRSELDAWYARVYGLTRDELRYVLDPADVMGEDYPSETFRVLKNNDLNKYGEYRTRRLVLEAWDRLEAGDVK